jgi:hypothetical protein
MPGGIFVIAEIRDKSPRLYRPQLLKYTDRYCAKISIFVLSIPHFTLSFYFACEISSQGYRHQLYEQLCAHLYHRLPTTSAGPQVCSAQQGHVAAS